MGEGRALPRRAGEGAVERRRGTSLGVSGMDLCEGHPKQCVLGSGGFRDCHLTAMTLGFIFFLLSVFLCEMETWMLISQGWWENQVRDGCPGPAGWQRTAADPRVLKPPGRTFSEGLLGRVGGLARKDHGKASPVEKTDTEGSVNVTRDGNVCRNPQILEKIKMEWGEIYTRPSGPSEEGAMCPWCRGAG